MPEAGWDHLMVRESTKKQVVKKVKGSTEDRKVIKMLDHYGIKPQVVDLKEEIDNKIETYYKEEGKDVNPQAMNELDAILEELESILEEAD